MTTPPPGHSGPDDYNDQINALVDALAALPAASGRYRTRENRLQIDVGAVTVDLGYTVGTLNPTGRDAVLVTAPGRSTVAFYEPPTLDVLQILLDAYNAPPGDQR